MIAAPTTESRETRAAALFFSQRAVEIAEFCLHNGGKAFAGWLAPTLYAYAFFHVVDRTVFLARSHGAITTAAFMWGRPESEIRQDATFNWKRSQDNADSLFLAEVVGSQRDLSKLSKQVSARWPDWTSKKVFTFRSGKLVQLPHETIERMIHVRK